MPAGERGGTGGRRGGSGKRMRQRAHGANGRAWRHRRAARHDLHGRAGLARPASERGRPIETCGSRASSATLALPRRLEAAPDGKWTCVEQLDKFRGLFSTFTSSWTWLAQTKLKDCQCISLYILLHHQDDFVAEISIHPSIRHHGSPTPTQQEPMAFYAAPCHG